MRTANILAAIGAMVCGLAWAQEGHPLVGSWHGDWGPDAKSRTSVTVVLDYNGKDVTGLINPGADSAKMTQATLDPSNWTVHFEADVKDRSGAMVRVVIEGKIENLTNVRRSIVGTWTQNGVKNDLKITRDN